MMKPIGMALLLALAACGNEDALPDDLPGLKTAAMDARDQALAARTGQDPKKAAKAAERAAKADQRAAALIQSRKDNPPPDVALASEIHAAARETRRLSRLTAEDKEIQDRTTGLKAKAYRTGRKTALAGVFQGFALAADQEAKGGQVPQGVHETAVKGAELADLLSGRQKGAEGPIDFAAVAADLRRLAGEPPAEMSAFFALALVLARQDGLALVEIESADVKTIKDPDWVVGTLLLRGIILRLNGLPESAGESFRAAGLAPTPESAKDLGQELQAGIHLAIAGSELSDKNYEAADIEIVRAMKAWPNNPVAVFLTGERLGAMGEREAAAKSLEASVAGTDQEWLAKKVAVRARELRDGSGPAEPMLFDSAILRDVALWHVGQAAKTSAPARKLQKWVDAARAFAARWTPGGSDGSEK